MTTFPSPQISEQTLAVVESPSVQVQSVSTVQVEEHPSLLRTLPSSHFPTMGTIVFPSPQISVHTLAVTESPRVQLHEASTAQIDEHPSPLVVPPSSQYPAVGTITFPSPQESEQILAVIESPKVQTQLISTEQVELHPSLATVFPSSQYPAVGFITKPSPQISEHELAVTESPNDHVHFASTEQVESHPSPVTVFPSSQYPAVGLKIFPSPQISVQTLAVIEFPSVHVHPVSTTQLASHPSPIATPPSSQYPAVGLYIFPSPHISVHELAVIESPAVQVHPVSTAQLESHPSPFAVLLSSQYPAIGFITFPSPHISEHTLAVVESPSVQV